MSDQAEDRRQPDEEPVDPERDDSPSMNPDELTKFEENVLHGDEPAGLTPPVPPPD